MPLPRLPPLGSLSSQSLLSSASRSLPNFHASLPERRFLLLCSNKLQIKSFFLTFSFRNAYTMGLQMELEIPIICTVAKIILIVTSSCSFSKLPEIKKKFSKMHHRFNEHKIKFLFSIYLYQTHLDKWLKVWKILKTILGLAIDVWRKMTLWWVFILRGLQA